MSESSFGRTVVAATSPDDVLGLESQAGKDELFSQIDVVAAGIFVRATRGERVARITHTPRGDALEIVGIPDALGASLRSLHLEAQQARGGWFLPETVSINARGFLFPALFAEVPRYAHTLIAEQRAKLALRGNPQAMLFWALLEPLGEALMAPVFLRVNDSGRVTRAEFMARWSEIEVTYGELGISAGDQLRPFAWGGGWGRFAAEQQVLATRRLLDAVAQHFDFETARRFRAAATQRLAAQYYAKAKNGRAKRRQVVTKLHGRSLAAFFGGDWLEFVKYLGEQPHDEERVATALPAPRVIVSGVDRAADLGARKGIAADEVQRILGALWNDAGGTSPVLDRAAAMTEFWRHFDAIHARQRPGMDPLWGLVEDEGWTTLEPQPHTPYQHALYRRLLPADLVDTVERLWSTTVLAKWPTSVVSEPFPHSAMAETLGPALKFWHGCALTAWFVCEGPTSRTDVAGIANYHARQLVELEDSGCPVDPQLFEQLRGVRLGPEQAIRSPVASSASVQGLSFETWTSSGTRRDGFEQLRDVITHYRRAWASRFLEAYVRARWETELKATARQFHLMTEEKGKPPTLKQFVKHAIAPARHWFGGDVGLLYTSLGQKLPNESVRRGLRLPQDTRSFVNAVFGALGGRPFERRAVVDSPDEARIQVAQQERHRELRRIAAESLTYVQLAEALGRSPTPKEFGAKFEWMSACLSEDPHHAWVLFSSSVERALTAVTPRYPVRQGGVSG
jgi:hypothetical protein